MGLINKDTIKKVRKYKWPNPYHLTKNDAKGYLKNVPLEIITLILKEMELQGHKNALLDAQFYGISTDDVLDWYATSDGGQFWNDIWHNKQYHVFYDKYTPELLRKRLEE